MRYSVLCVFVFSLAIAGVARADQPQAAPNLLPNGAFEEMRGDAPVGWTSRAWSGSEAASWTVAEPGRTGKQCLAIASEQGSDVAWSTTVTVRPNTAYRLSGWIKTEDVRGAVGALLNIQNMQSVRSSVVKGTQDWTRVSAVFRSGTETRLEVNCLFGGWGVSTGKAWYDDMALEPADFAGEETTATVTIDPEAASIPYSRMIFGGFLEHFGSQVYGGVFDPDSPLSDEQGFRREVIEAVRELEVSVVRWPGGCFASGYNWKEGVGQSRPATPDPVWGVTDPNTFGTDEFVAWCRAVGAEPYICTNAGNGTPEEMAEWVEYCNSEDGRSGGPLGVRFWSIGNENWGSHEIGARTADEWGPLVRESAEQMLAADPKLVLLAAATPQRSWTLPLLETAGKHLDYVCVHHYWLGNWQTNATPDYRSCVALSDGPEELICQVIEVLEEAGVRGRVKIAFDEWNLRGWHHPGFPRKEPVKPDDSEAAELIKRRELNAVASQYSMADALFSASFLNACLRHADDVGMANIAPIVNTRGPIYVHPKGIVRRTTYHTLALYARKLEERVGKLTVECGPLWAGNRMADMVDAVATVDEAGRHWALAMVNRHPSEAVACTVRLGDKLLEGRFDATVLAGDSPDAFNDVERPNRVVPEEVELAARAGVIKLAPHSLTILRLRRE